MLPELQTFLAELAEGKVQRADGVIAVREDGSTWSGEDRLQVVVSAPAGARRPPLRAFTVA